MASKKIVYKKVLIDDDKFISPFSMNKCCLTYELNKITEAPLTKLGNRQLLFAYKKLEDAVDIDIKNTIFNDNNYKFAVLKCEAKISDKQSKFMSSYTHDDDLVELFWDNIDAIMDGISKLNKKDQESIVIMYSVNGGIRKTFTSNDSSKQHYDLLLSTIIHNTIFCDYIKPIEVISDYEIVNKFFF